MPDLLILGGLTTDYHNFAEIGPAIVRALEPAGFRCHRTEDLSALSEGNLHEYVGIVNYTTARDLSDPQWAALQAFVRNGGGYIGIHNATDTFKNQPEAIRLIGGLFINHPPQLDVPVEIVDPDHPITQGVQPFTLFDELYVMEHDPGRYHLLAQTHAHGVQPIAWTREEGQGRVFYMSLGHNAACYDDPMYARFLGRGAQWATRQPLTA